MQTSGARSGGLGSYALMFIAASTVALGCAPAKREGPPPSPAVGPDVTADAGAATTLVVDASEDGLSASGTVDLSGAVPQMQMSSVGGEGLSKRTLEAICFAPSSAKLPADAPAKLAAVAKQFKSEPTERSRITVEPRIVPLDSQATASKIRAERASAVVGALVKQGLDRKAIVVTGPEVPRTEWSMPSFGGMSAFGEEPAPCVEVALATRGSGL